MRIAIDCRLFSDPHAEEHFFGAAIVQRLLKLPGEQHFFLLFDRTPTEDWGKYKNATVVVLKPMAENATTRAIWYDLRLPASLATYKADLFLGAVGYISLRSKVKQIILLQDALGGKKSPAFTGWPGSWYKRRLPAMLEKSDQCVVQAASLLKGMGKHHEVGHCQILPSFPLWPKDFKPDRVDRDAVKKALTGGKEYFFCREGWQTLDGALELLLAFSAFKKRQQTGMKLLLYGIPPREKDWPEKLQTYRYRDDVVLLNEAVDSKGFAEIFCAAYGLIQLPKASQLGTIQQALAAGVPVITNSLVPVKELVGDAVLYCSDAPGESLAQHMMRLYKDEKFRSELVKQGREKAAAWEPSEIASMLLASCLATISKG